MTDGPPRDDAPVARTLLAVDLGLYAGLACFDLEARSLMWFRSQHFGTVTRLKRAIPKVLDACPGLSAVILEGDRHLGELWQRLAEKRGARVRWVSPEEWRAALMIPRERRSGAQAKETALKRAREVIEACGVRRPRTPLVDDVAEAICIGHWAVQR